MKILQTLLLTLVITSSLIEFEVLCHKQGVSVSTTISIGEDKNAAKALAPAAQDKSGYLGLGIVNNKVAEVFPGSPSAKAGIVVGDKILDVNDKTTYGLTVAAIADKLIGPTGTSVDVILEHGDDQRKLNLVRATPVVEEAQRIVMEVAAAKAAAAADVAKAQAGSSTAVDKK
jgi:C-terminal processing protease CtpA/Prc